MFAKDVMKKSVMVINQEKTLKDAAMVMKKENCGSIPVEKGRKLVGMITDRDITIRAVALDKKTSVEKIKNYMTKGITYCYEDDDLDEVGRLMAQKKLRRLPVVNKNKDLVGIISITDMVQNKLNEELVCKTLIKLTA